MEKAQRPINPSDFTSIPRIREIMKKLPDEIRICSECGEEVTISESEFLPTSSDSAPFAKAAFVGCCDSAIDKVIVSIRKLQIGK